MTPQLIGWGIVALLVLGILYFAFRSGVKSTRAKMLESILKNKEREDEENNQYLKDVDVLTTDCAASRGAVRKWVRKVLHKS